jgi:Protein of unknown function (DUF5132)
MKIFGMGLDVGGLALGAAVVILAPVVLPVVGTIAKTVSKAAIKGGLTAYQGTKSCIAESRQLLSDLTAEAKAELSKGAST